MSAAGERPAGAQRGTRAVVAAVLVTALLVGALSWLAPALAAIAARRRSA